MSRLEDLISRFQAQKSHLDRAIDACAEIPGIVVEIGLGSGRTFDHLREKLTHRDLYAFDRRVETHPGCEPAPHQQVLGRVEKTLPEFAKKNHKQAALVHIDIGSKNYQEDLIRYQTYLPYLKDLLREKALLVSDRPLDDSQLISLTSTQENKNWRYFSYIMEASQERPISRQDGALSDLEAEI